MPVHAVKGGYQWGNHGKVYKSKADAEKQGRAAYANGYRGDAKLPPGDAKMNFRYDYGMEGDGTSEPPPEDEFLDCDLTDPI